MFLSHNLFLILHILTGYDMNMKHQRLEITEGMRRFLDYPKFKGPTRMLVMKTQYFFDDSWKRAAEELGWSVETVTSAIVGDVLMDDIKDLFFKLAEFKPDFILASNYAGMDESGLFARFFDDAHIPYVSWFTDTPRMILFNRVVHKSHYAVAATWEKSYTKHLKDRGFDNVFHMPLATDPHIFNGNPQDVWQRDLAFVGNPMIEYADEAWEKLAHMPAVIAAIKIALDRGHIDRETYLDGIDVMLPPELIAECNSSERRNIELAINYEATRRQRCDMVKRLEQLGIEVRGDDRWLKVTNCVGGALGYFDDLGPFYRSTAVNVNTTSLQMKTAVNQRVFDCPAAGGFLITDNQSSLNEMFDVEKEVVTYDSLDELKDKVVYYLAHPEDRNKIVKRAQKRITQEHTHQCRLRDLEIYLKNLYS